jgi:hypothetical protein
VCKTHSKGNTMARFWTIFCIFLQSWRSSDKSFRAKHSLTMIPATKRLRRFAGYNLRKVWWFQGLNTIQCTRTCKICTPFWTKWPKILVMQGKSLNQYLNQCHISIYIYQY